MAAAAGISAGASLLNGIMGGKAAKKAAKIQAKAYQSGIDEQRNEFNTIQANNQPYMSAGTSALGQMLSLLGLSGSDNQASSIAALKNSPLFTSQYDTGADTILQNASATGGLRGGNTEHSLADFGSQLLASVLQGQIGNLGSVVGVGQSAASGTNTAAANTGNNISNLLAQKGNAAASGALTRASLFGQTVNNVGGSLANLLAQSTGGGITNLTTAALNPASQSLIASNPGIF